MILKLITAFYNAFWEELKSGAPWRNKLLLAFRIILFIASIGFTGLLLLITLLAEHEGTKTEIMSLYICIIYIVFLLGNFVTPWRVISISKRLSIIYVSILLTSFLFFSLVQIVNLLFHEGNLKWESLTDIYQIYPIQLALLIVIISLFLINYKTYHSDQKMKNLKAEWNRLSSWTKY
jgi:membrane protease YdiL (CAAX protease family)